VKKIHLVVFTFLSISSFSQIYSKQKGVCWVGGREEVTEKEIAALKKCNVTWISQTPFAFQRNANESEIKTHFTSDQIWWGESDEGISKTTVLARKAGIKTILKPHLWVSKGWPGEIKMKSDTAWQRWFLLYEKFILHYAELAERNQIEILCIGTELHQTLREKEWRAVIASVRKVYKGKLTYAANFHEEYQQVMFWDALDYIGIQAYFPLTKSSEASIADLKGGWKAHLSSIEQIHKKYNRPVLFTEIGYRSDANSAIEPWVWPKENQTASVAFDVQANCYKAFFETVWGKNWLAGVYFWKWYPHGPKRMIDIDFTPQGKPAEKILRDGYKM